MSKHLDLDKMRLILNYLRYKTGNKKSLDSVLKTMSSDLKLSENEIKSYLVIMFSEKVDG